MQISEETGEWPLEAHTVSTLDLVCSGSWLPEKAHTCMLNKGWLKESLSGPEGISDYKPQFNLFMLRFASSYP